LLNQSSLFHETLEKEFPGDDTLKDVKVYVSVEYDQRVITGFLFNEQCNANQISIVTESAQVGMIISTRVVSENQGII
jgi:hypothetical protein